MRCVLDFLPIIHPCELSLEVSGIIVWETIVDITSFKYTRQLLIVAVVPEFLWLYTVHDQLVQR